MLLAVWFVLWGLVGTGRADDLDGVVAAPQLPEGVEVPKKEKEADEPSDAEKAAEAKRREKQPRVIVLKWYDREVDYADPTLQRTVRSRIVRPDAAFYPEVDLYQNGRKVRDRTVVPAMQPASVPQQNIDRVRDAIDEVSAIPWNGMPPDRWGLRAQQLREIVELIWFVDRVELRQPLFELYAQIGRAAENQNQILPPFYEQIGTIPVNYYHYLAALLALQDPALLGTLDDGDVRDSIAGIAQQLKNGAFPTLRIDFQQEGIDFDEEEFNKAYEVYLNGVIVEPDSNGQMEIHLGRTDIYLKRKDSGHGLSERLEVTKLEDKPYFVRDAARKKMGIEFIRQLFLHPNECTPALDGDILNYLAIYQKIHEKADIYIAVPEEGNPNRVYVWRYDRPTATLQLVSGGGDAFPVRFAIVSHAGIMFNKAAPAVDRSYQPPTGATLEELDASDATNRFDPNLAPAYIPWDFELRVHYNRLAVSLGAEFGFNTGGGVDVDAIWVETYRTPGSDALVVERSEGEWQYAYNRRSINRDLFLGVGVILGRDAGIGFGPRLATRVGWTNLPYALQTTGHVGWTLPLPGVKAPADRVRPLLDVDARIGASWPFPASLANDGGITVLPVFGLVVGVGTTF